MFSEPFSYIERLCLNTWKDKFMKRSNEWQILLLGKICLDHCAEPAYDIGTNCLVSILKMTVINLVESSDKSLTLLTFDISYLTFEHWSIWAFEHLNILTFEHLNIWTFEHWNIGTLEHWDKPDPVMNPINPLEHLKIWRFDHLKIWTFEPWE